ncbi:MAG: dihydroorotase [Candidatus Ancillula sp.]|nr:dihydroorotase [Candidatus Ancillula sp.]
MQKSKSSRIIGRLYGAGDVVEVQVDALSGKITSITPTNEESELIILPGLVDLHTHLRQPGQENSETIATGSRAAAAGGYTCVHAMANTIPVSDTASSVEQTARIGDEVGLVEVRPIGAVTKGLNGVKMAELGAMAESNAKVKMFSDDGKCVFDPLIMRRALEYVKAFDGIIAQHSQDPRLTENAQMNEGALSSKLGLQGWPAVAEESIIARDILLAKHTGSRLHICHLSTKGAVEIVRFAKSQGINVTAEATPHHLYLSEEELAEYNPRYKVNPPLRRREDVEAVQQGVIDGTIDIIGTDHAPHALELKYCNFQDSAFGMTGLETALRVIDAVFIKTDRLTWRDVVRIMSEKPAQIVGLSSQGQELKVGNVANICVYNPNAESEIVPEEQYTKSTNSPFKHKTLPGEVVATFYRGRQTHGG